MKGFETEIFARRLKALREERGMDQDQLAKATGVSKGAIARYETGKNLPRIDTALILADALGCSIDVLSGRTPLIPA